jgi:predicted PurR-regulated permease PerM
MKKQYGLQNQIFFYGIFALVVFLSLLLVQSYFGVISFGLLMVVILKPLFDFFMRWVKGKAGIATLLTLITLFLALLIPGWFLIQLATSEVDDLIGDLDLPSGQGEVSMDTFVTEVNSLLQQVPFPVPGTEDGQISDEQQQQLQAAAKSAAAWVASVLVNLGLSIPNLIASTFIFLGIVGVLLPNYDSFVERIIHLSPLEDEVDRYYLRKIKAIIWSMFISIFVIAIAQGLVTGLLFVIAGVPFSSLWTTLAILASMMPLGASLIAIPIGVAALITGNTVSAIIVLAGYFLIVANVDTVLRPKLVSKEAYLNFALVLLGALGGYAWFGFFGVIYGPLILVLLTTTVDVYANFYLRTDESASLTDEAIATAKPAAILNAASRD